MSKQEFSVGQPGQVNNENVICKLSEGKAHIPVCRKCCFDHEDMSKTCDTVKCMSMERTDGKRVYFELIHQEA